MHKQVVAIQNLHIGVTSPLIGTQAPMPDLGAMQLCGILERLTVKPFLLRNDMSPLDVIEQAGLHGIIFTGGGDIAPGSYGGNTAFAHDDVDLRRDVFEFALMEQAFAHKLPVLAICRGMQIANVVLNGTLIEDLPSRLGPAYRLMHHQTREANLPHHAYAHHVEIYSDTLLWDVLRTSRLRVNSIHHQSIDELGSTLRVSARAEDGVIEAIEFERPFDRAFFLGVQWHPEWIPDDPASQRLYTRFIRACVK